MLARTDQTLLNMIDLALYKHRYGKLDKQKLLDFIYPKSAIGR